MSPCADATTSPFAVLVRTRTHAICTVGDKDFIKITGTAGQKYRIVASNVAAGLDVVIEGFDANGVLLGEVDDAASGGEEIAILTFGANGSLYIAFSEWLNNAGQSSLTYNARVTLEPAGSGNGMSGGPG